MGKEVASLDAIDAVLDPPDADYLFSAKVMLMSTPAIQEIYKKCFARAEDVDTEKLDDERDFIHPTRLINFLVGLRGKNETMAIGGAWSKKLDGKKKLYFFEKKDFLFKFKFFIIRRKSTIGSNSFNSNCNSNMQSSDRNRSLKLQPMVSEDALYEFLIMLFVHPNFTKQFTSMFKKKLSWSYYDFTLPKKKKNKFFPHFLFVFVFFHNISSEV